MRIMYFLLLSGFISLNASMYSAIAGPHFTSDDYESKERGIIVQYDKDSDGIDDRNDTCFDEKMCNNPDVNGCFAKKEIVVTPIPLDSDSDGVIDSIDECPNTPTGYQVDEKGCAILIDLKVHFDVDKYNIKEEYTGEIKRFIEFMKSHPTLEAVIEGHTDSTASNEYNMELSNNRANSVRDYILENSEIEKIRLNAIGYGETKPLNDNSTAQKRQKNRRVVVTLNRSFTNKKFK